MTYRPPDRPLNSLLGHKKYIYEPADWDEHRHDHRWSAVGGKGAIAMHMIVYGENRETSVGIEFYYREPPSHMRDHPPTFLQIDLLNGLGWHDGTSLGARAYEHDMQTAIETNDHRVIWSILERLYLTHIIEQGNERGAEYDQ